MTMGVVTATAFLRTEINPPSIEAGNLYFGTQSNVEWVTQMSSSLARNCEQVVDCVLASKACHKLDAFNGCAGWDMDSLSLSLCVVCRCIVFLVYHASLRWFCRGDADCPEVPNLPPMHCIMSVESRLSSGKGRRRFPAEALPTGRAVCGMPGCQGFSSSVTTCSTALLHTCGPPPSFECPTPCWQQFYGTALCFWSQTTPRFPCGIVLQRKPTWHTMADGRVAAFESNASTLPNRPAPK